MMKKQSNMEATIQFIYLHPSIYKLYSYARKQEILDAYRDKYEKIVTDWERLKTAGTSTKVIAEFVGYSRAT